MTPGEKYWLDTTPVKVIGVVWRVGQVKPDANGIIHLTDPQENGIAGEMVACTVRTIGGFKVCNPQQLSRLMPLPCRVTRKVS